MILGISGIGLCRFWLERARTPQDLALDGAPETGRQIFSEFVPGDRFPCGDAMRGRLAMGGSGNDTRSIRSR